MATTSVNVYVAPEDGWVQIVAPSTISFLEVRPFPYNHGIYLFVGAAKPTELYEPTGMKLDEACFHMEVTTAAATGAWVRCLTPAWGGGKHTDNQKQRVDVIYTAT